MLVEHQSVEPHLFGEFVFIEILIVQVGAQLGIEMSIRESQADRAAKTITYRFFGIGYVGALGKSHYEHGESFLTIRGCASAPKRLEQALWPVPF
jgi:hypothetical protein